MKALFGFVVRWIVPLLGLVALSLIIWFVGPLFDVLASPAARWTLIGLLFAAWLAWRVYALVKARRQAAKVLQSLAAETPPDPASVATAQELGSLRQRMDEALALLKKARLGGDERRNLYELPWYVIIGPPGSGKTTALVNSGLHFPLAAQLGEGAIRGVGGTRNCDWWFTDQAVLLDTAGRYTTQDSHAQVDKAAWLGFLDLLRQQRSRRPIDGAFIAISLSDLLLASEAERAAHAAAIRARIQELYERLGVRFPIYLMLTKLDLVPGFMEFFDNLGKEERAQVWGMTFALDDGGQGEGPLGQFAGEFALLEQRLNQRLVERLQQERDPSRRDLVYGFAQQFAALRGSLESFLDGVFKPNAFETRALLRGVYFTSGTQEGSPIDRLIGSMAQSMGLDRAQLARQSGSGRSYFIQRLFSDVAFAERGLAGSNPKVERRRRWLTRGALALSVLLVLVVGTLWALSYRANQAYIAQVEQRLQPVGQSVQALSPAQRSVLDVLPLLNAVRHLADDPPAWAEGLGLYQGDMLESESASVYRKLLIAVFAPRLVTRIEEQLYGAQSSDYLYEGLKAYLMLADGDHYDADFIKAWVLLDWERALPRDLAPEQRQDLQRHLDALFERRPPNARLDQHLIDDVRRQLQQLPVAQRVYDRVKRQPLPPGVNDVRLSEAAGRDAALVLRRKSGKPLGEPLPGLFTVKGYRQAFLAASLAQSATLAEERWVLGREINDAGDAKRLADDVRQLYFQDYIRQWEQFLSDIQLNSSADLSQRINTARLLSGNHSPLRQLVINLSNLLTLNRAQPDEKTAQAAKPSDNSATRTLEALFTSPEAAAARGQAAAQASPEQAVAVHFAPVLELAQPLQQGSKVLAVDDFLHQIDDLYRYLTAVQDAANSGMPPPASDAISRLQASAGRLPGSLQNMVSSMAVGASSDAQRRDMDNVRKRITMEVGSFCRQAIAGRYPLVRSARSEVTPDDLARMFAPGSGMMDSFFRDNLASKVDTTNASWRFTPGIDGKTLPGGEALLRPFQQAQSIRDAFFANGATTPGFRVTLRTVKMGNDILNLTLDVDGQQLRYSHGPQAVQMVSWPGPGGTSQVRMQLGLTNGTTSTLVTSGPWALNRFFDRARVTAAGGLTREATFSVEGHQVTLSFTPGSIRNPFQLPGFSCP